MLQPRGPYPALRAPAPPPPPRPPRPCRLGGDASDPAGLMSRPAANPARAAAAAGSSRTPGPPANPGVERGRGCLTNLPTPAARAGGERQKRAPPAAAGSGPAAPGAPQSWRSRDGDWVVPLSRFPLPSQGSQPGAAIFCGVQNAGVGG